MTVSLKKKFNVMINNEIYDKMDRFSEYKFPPVKNIMKILEFGNGKAKLVDRHIGVMDQQGLKKMGLIGGVGAVFHILLRNGVK